MKKINLLFLAILTINSSIFAQLSSKFVSDKTHIKFYSHTSFEDIEANNYKSISTIDLSSGIVIFSVPMQSFEFEKSLMQKHYNSEGFLNTKNFPKAKMTGYITNVKEINFSKDGSYEADVEGELTIKGVTNPIKTKGTILVKGYEISIESVFDITLADYGVTFSKGKPSTNIAKDIEVTVIGDYSRQ